MIRLLLVVIAATCASCCYAQQPLLAQESIPEVLPIQIEPADDEPVDNKISEARLRELKRKRTRNHILSGTLVLLAGAADGLNQALLFRYDGFKRTFPGACNKFWDPRLSGANKYKNGDPKQGAKFPGSRTWLVFVTDGYHLTRFINHLFMSGAIGVKIAGHEKKKWYKYILESAAYWIVNRTGFCLVYNRF